MIPEKMSPQPNAKKVIIFGYLCLLSLILLLPKIDLTAWISSQQTLSILVFSEMIDRQLLQDFAQHHNVRLNVKYADTDSEVYYLLNNTIENANFDLAIISDYMLKTMPDTLLQPIDTAKISNYHHLHPYFTSRRHSKGIPFCWNFYGICTTEKKHLEHPWHTLFACDADIIALMPDDPQILIAAAKIYLASIGQHNPTLTMIKELLKKQKNCVELYSDTNLTNIFVKNVVNIGLLPFGAFKKIEAESADCTFIVPQQSFMITQYFTISSVTKKSELAHACIDFMLDHEAALKNSTTTSFLPTHHQALKDLRKRFKENKTTPIPSQKTWQHFHTCDHDISREQLSQVWIELKNS